MCITWENLSIDRYSSTFTVPSLADFADVVPAKIHQHVVLRQLLLVTAEVLLPEPCLLRRSCLSVLCLPAGTCLSCRPRALPASPATLPKALCRRWKSRTCMATDLLSSALCMYRTGCLLLLLSSGSDSTTWKISPSRMYCLAFSTMLQYCSFEKSGFISDFSCSGLKSSFSPCPYQLSPYLLGSASASSYELFYILCASHL